MKENVLSIKLKEFRKEKQMTQQELAELLDVSDKTISKWELGDTYPSRRNMLKLAELLDISLETLLLEENDDEKEKLQVNIKFIYGILLLLVVFAVFIIASVIGDANKSKEKEAIVAETPVSSMPEMDPAQEELKAGIISREQIKELKTKYFYYGSITYLAYDGKFYYLHGIEEENSLEEVHYKLNKFNLMIGGKDIIKKETVSPLTTNYFIGSDDLRVKVSAGGEMFSYWELKEENDMTVFVLDTGEKRNAETGELVD